MPTSMELVESAVLAFFGAMTLFASIPIAIMLSVFSFFSSCFGKRMREAKTIVITGASSGIGAHLALEYAQHGTRVIIMGRNETKLHQVERACSERGAEVRLIKVDVTDKGAMNKILRDMDAEYNGLDIVICNAGVAADNSFNSVRKLGIDGVAKLMVDTNVLGVFNTLAPAVDVMHRRGRGHIVIIGSIVGLFGNPNFAIYCATKTFMHSLSRDLFFPLQKKNIALSLVAPGCVETAMSNMAHDNFGSSFPKFLYWSPERSARFIKSGVAAGMFYIAFPKYLEFTLYMMSVLPPPLQVYASALAGYSGVMGKPAGDVLLSS